MKAFSYCVYGSDLRYCKGMIRNIEQITELFPDFTIYISLGNDVPSNYIEIYKKHPNVIIKPYNFTGGRLMSYRFLIIDEDNVDIMLVRDADSRFSKRDIWCIQNFLNQDIYNLFTIRDHKFHDKKVMGGQWGIKKIEQLDITKEYELFRNEYSNIDSYNSDQLFLDKHIYSKYLSKFIIYTSTHRFEDEHVIDIPYPKISNSDFCGCVYLYSPDDIEYPWC